MKTEEKIKNALIKIQYTDPLYSEFIIYFKLKEEPGILTGGVYVDADNINLLYNTKFVDSLNLEELCAFVKHEIGHVFLNHLYVRLPDPMIDNLAADIEINQEPFLKLPKKLEEISATYDKYGLQPKLSREQYYNLLQKNKKPRGGEGGGGPVKPIRPKKPTKGTDPEPLDDHSVWNKSQPGTEKIWEQRIKEIIEESARRGLIPGEFVERIKAAWKKHKDLKHILKRIITTLNIGEQIPKRHWLRPNIRYPFKPGEIDIYKGMVIVAIDTSGSMTTHMLEEVLGVLKWAKRIGYNVQMIQCDAQITDVSKLKNVTEIDIKGRGGTSSIPVFNYIKEKYKDKIKGLIFFTDLETDYPETKPAYKVYWVVTQEKYKDPPFGNVIHLTEK